MVALKLSLAAAATLQLLSPCSSALAAPIADDAVGVAVGVAGAATGELHRRDHEPAPGTKRLVRVTDSLGQSSHGQALLRKLTDQRGALADQGAASTGGETRKPYTKHIYAPTREELGKRGGPGLSTAPIMHYFQNQAAVSQDEQKAKKAGHPMTKKQITKDAEAHTHRNG